MIKAITLENVKDFENLFVIYGANSGLFPHCHSYFWVENEEIIIFDPQCGKSRLEQNLKAMDMSWENITHIINTHFHVDHTAFNLALKDLNPDVKIWIHSTDKAALESNEEYFRRYGLYDDLKDEYQSIMDFMDHKPTIPDKIFENGDLLPGEFKVIHTPGHTPGHCCFFKLGNLIAGDIDCTTPWLGNITSDTEDFINSIDALLNMDIDNLLPGHGEPINGRAKIEKELVKYKQKLVDISQFIFTLLDTALPLELIVSLRNQGSRSSIWRKDPLMLLFRENDTRNYLQYLEKMSRIQHVEDNGEILWKRID